jgi:hypothetical protein
MSTKNLYKITWAGYSGKHLQDGTITYAFAENDEQVYEWIASEPEVDGEDLYNDWKMKEEYKWDEGKKSFVNEFGKKVEWLNEDGEPENFKDRMMRLQGEDVDEIALEDIFAVDDCRLYGWSLCKENVSTDNSELIELGMAIELPEAEAEAEAEAE